MDFYERPLICPQINNIYYHDDKLEINIKLYSLYNIYFDDKVVVNLIIEDIDLNKIYKFSGKIKNDIFSLKIDKNELKKINGNIGEYIIKLEVSDIYKGIISSENVKGYLWEENEFSSELDFYNDNSNLIIINKREKLLLYIYKDICINEIGEIQSYFGKMKILFKSEKNINSFEDKNFKIKLSINEEEYISYLIENINDNYFYAYNKVHNIREIIDKIFKNEVFITVIVNYKKYRNKLEVSNYDKVYRCGYDILKLKIKEYF